MDLCLDIGQAMSCKAAVALRCLGCAMKAVVLSNDNNNTSQMDGGPKRIITYMETGLGQHF